MINGMPSSVDFPLHSKNFPFFFKMVQNNKVIYGFVRTTKEDINGKLFSLRVKGGLVDMTKKNPLAYYNELLENKGISDLGVINRFESGNYEEIKKEVLQTKWIKKIKIESFEYDVYQIINSKS